MLNKERVFEAKVPYGFSPPPSLPMTALPGTESPLPTGVLRVGDHAAGLYITGSGAVELADWICGMCESVIKYGVMDNPTLSLLSFVLAHAGTLALADPTGKAVDAVKDARGRLDHAVALLTATPVGGAH